MKRIPFVLMLVTVITSFIISCNKISDIAPQKSSPSDTIVTLNPIGERKGYLDTINVSAKYDLYQIIEAAKSYKDIPTYNFSCASNYKSRYKHLKQPNNTSCSWTSYVVYTGDVIKAYKPWSNAKYDVSVKHVNEVMELCRWSKSITALQDYGNTYDGNYARFYVEAYYKKSTNKLTVIKWMLKYMYLLNRPYITITRHSSGVGHYLTIFGIQWKKGLTGSRIYFMDTLEKDYGSFDENIRSMDLEEFLYNMEKCSSTNYYNFLYISQLYL